MKEKDSISSLSLCVKNRLSLVNLSNQEVHLWDVIEEKMIQTFTGQKQGKYIVRSCFGGHDESFVYSGSEDGNIYVWHGNTGNAVDVLKGHQEGTVVSSVAWNKQKRILASAGDDHSVQIWSE